MSDIMAAAVALYCNGSSEPFDPSSGEDQQWLTNTYIFLQQLADEPGVTEIQAHFPGAEEVNLEPVPAPVPAPIPIPVAPPVAVPVPVAPVVPLPVAPVAPVVPLPVPVQAPAPAHTPAPVQGLHAGSQDQEKWAHLCQEFQTNGQLVNWYDNRLGKRNPKGPDFRHKSIDQAPTQTGNVYKLSLFMKDAPDFALQILAQYPPAQPTQ